MPDQPPPPEGAPPPARPGYDTHLRPPSAPPPSASAARPTPPPAQAPPGGWQPAGGYPNYAGYQQPPQPQPPAAHPPAGYQPLGPPSGPPPGAGGSGRGLMIGVAVLVLVLLAGGAAVGVVLWQGRDDDRSATDDPAGTPTETSTSSTPATPTPSAPTTPTPPRNSPSAVSPPPAPPAPDPDAGTGPFSYTEYGNDWNFRFPGSPHLRAAFKRGWDYDTCRPVERGGALTALGCRYASQWTYRALGGDLALMHIVLTMTSDRAAKRAIDRSAFDDSDWRVEDAAYLRGRDGSWRADARSEFIVITVETHERSVRAAQAKDFLDYGNTDILAALGFRF